MGGLVKGFIENGINRYIKDDTDAQGAEFGVIHLEEGDEFSLLTDKEYLFNLCYGNVLFSWNDEKRESVRKNWIDEDPTVLSVPQGTDIKILSLSGISEINYACTDNENNFIPRFIQPENLLSSEIVDEYRLGGKLRRKKRSFYDWDTHPDSNLFCGEIVNYPGSWACFPPHLHDEPEIYHYRFYPEMGYGFSEYGNEARKVEDHDTICIPGNMLHSQVTAPGYYGYVMWIQRLKDNGVAIEYRMTERHSWLDKEE